MASQFARSPHWLGIDPEHNDGFRFRYSPIGAQTHPGKPAFCIECHSEAEGDNFVFLSD